MSQLTGKINKKPFQEELHGGAFICTKCGKSADWTQWTDHGKQYSPYMCQECYYTEPRVPSPSTDKELKLARVEAYHEDEKLKEEKFTRRLHTVRKRRKVK